MSSSEVRKWGVAQDVSDDVPDDMLPMLQRSAAATCVRQVQAKGYEPIEDPITRVVDNPMRGEWQDPDTGEWFGMPRRTVFASLRCIRAIPGISGSGGSSE